MVLAYPPQSIGTDQNHINITAQYLCLLRPHFHPWCHDWNHHYKGTCYLQGHYQLEGPWQLYLGSFPMSGILCEEVPEGGNEMVTPSSTRPGKKTPENITQVLTNAALRFAHNRSEHNVPKPLSVNSDQTGVRYSADNIETYAPIGSKQVEVVGKDERRAFTLMVGISMSGEVLPF